MLRVGTALAIMAAALIAMPAAAAPIVYVMRHLDTPEGVRDPDLTPTGKARAERVRAWFARKPLAAIYVSDYKRTRQTAAPIAAERGLSVTIYDPADTPGLIELVRSQRKPVLIVGHSNTVPDIVEALGGERPPALGHPDFGDIWTITDGRTEKASIPEDEALAPR